MLTRSVWQGKRTAFRRYPLFLFPAYETYFLEECFMPLPTRYESEIKTVPFGGGTIRVENLTPILSPKDRAKRKREIETRLFDVFSKYEVKKRKAAK
jgi:hypothetical protein